MVNQEIVDYLKEGQKRGFKIALLREKLLGGGFKEEDVNEAVMSLQEEAKPVFNSFDFKSEIKKIPTAGKTKWMKVGGICGIGLLVFTALVSILSFFIPNLLGDYIVIIIFGVLMVLLMFFYYFGFVKLGKYAESKLIRIGAWMTIAGIILFAIAGAAGAFYIWKNLAVFATGNISSLKTILIDLGVAIAVSILLLIIGHVIFSIGLIKARSKVGLAKITGILRLCYLILCIVVTVAFVMMSLATLKTVASSVSAGVPDTASLIGLLASAIIFIVGYAIAGILKLAAYVLEVLILFGASKKFES